LIWLFVRFLRIGYATISNYTALSLLLENFSIVWLHPSSESSDKASGLSITQLAENAVTLRQVHHPLVCEQQASNHARQAILRATSSSRKTIFAALVRNHHDALFVARG